MFRFVIFVFALSACSAVDPECYMNTTQLIAENGFESEAHFATTDDGYILQIFRIKPRRDIPVMCTNDKKLILLNAIHLLYHVQHHVTNTEPENSPVVFFQHGLSSSSDFFLLNRRSGSFPFILSDKGYDVWLGNVRGNIYCLNHTSLSPDSHQFWDFSFQEMAEIDLPVMVDRVLEVTGRSQLFYLGHSQGTEMAFIGLSSNPLLASKISLVMALAPIARLTYGRGLLEIIKEFVGMNWLLYWVLGNKQFNPPSALGTYIATKICPEDAITLGLCETFDSLTKGFDISNINKTRFPIYYSHGDASTSTKDIIHWAQLIQYEQIQKFDYGTDSKNMERYNSTKPPVYDISKLSVPTVLVAGGNDWLGDTRDVMWLINTIHHTLVDVMFVDKYNHDDYIQGMDAPQLVFKPLIEIMKRFVEGYDTEIMESFVEGHDIGK